MVTFNRSDIDTFKGKIHVVCVDCEDKHFAFRRNDHESSRFGRIVVSRESDDRSSVFKIGRTIELQAMVFAGFQSDSFRSSIGHIHLNTVQGHLPG